MRKIINKVMILALGVVCACLVSACGSKTDSNEEHQYEVFNKKAEIKETVLVDKDGIKITATGIEYELSKFYVNLEIANNTSGAIQVSESGTESVNGYMIDAYMSDENPVEPGAKEKKEIVYEVRNLWELGIENIASLQTGFIINDSNGEKISEAAPVMIKTTIYNKYDFDEDTYVKMAKDPVYSRKDLVEYMVFTESSNEQKEDVEILSCALSEPDKSDLNESGRVQLNLEIKNHSEKAICCEINTIEIDGITLLSQNDMVKNRNVVITGGNTGIFKYSIDKSLIYKIFNPVKTGYINVNVTAYDMETGEVTGDKVIKFIASDENTSFTLPQNAAYEDTHLIIKVSEVDNIKAVLGSSRVINMTIENVSSGNIIISDVTDLEISGEKISSLEFFPSAPDAGRCCSIAPGEIRIYSICIPDEVFWDRGISTYKIENAHVVFEYSFDADGSNEPLAMEIKF